MPLTLIREDITHMRVDAIVNAANTTLLGGGGVDGAIHAAAGPELLEACRALGGCPTGEARITRGYRLPARYVIHTPGPIWRGGGQGEARLLASCYRSSLQLAAQYQLESIAFPMISTGAYGYPKAEALQIALEEIISFLVDHDMQVYLVSFGKEMFLLSDSLFPGIRQYVDDEYAGRALRNAPSRGKGAFLNRMFELARKQKNSRPDLEEELFFPEEEASLTESSPFEEITSAPLSPIMAPPKPAAAAPDSRPGGAPSPDLKDLQEYLRSQDISFSQALLRAIDEKGLSDADCYKRANIDRKLFNRIKNKQDYHPRKQTVLAFIVALKMTEEEAQHLLGYAGYTLTESSRMDRAILYFLRHSYYDIHRINIMLYDLDLPQLGA